MISLSSFHSSVAGDWMWDLQATSFKRLCETANIPNPTNGETLENSGDATGLPRGASRSELKRSGRALNSSHRESPRGKPVASLEFSHILAVGGLFIRGLHRTRRPAILCFTRTRRFLVRLTMKHPPTALVGLRPEISKLQAPSLQDFIIALGRT